MKLVEVFDSKVNYEVTKQTANSFRAKGAVGGRDIIFSAELSDDGVWYLEFVEVRPNNAFTTRLTGSGSSLQVFSLILSAVRHLVELYQPGVLEFTSSKKDGARTALYGKLAAKFKDNYKLTTTDDGQETTFRLEAR